MDLMIKNYIERAGNEIVIAETLNKISIDLQTKQSFGIDDKTTFYSSVISHSYYAIFYIAKAILLTKNVKTDFPEVHKKTYEEFEKYFVKTGTLDVKLLKIYKEMIIKADYLLEIFKDLKINRGKFAYKTIPQANKEPAEKSLENAKTFVSNIIKVIENGNVKL